MKRFLSPIEPDERGTSLIELLIYVVIVTVVLLLTSQFAVAMIRGQRRAGEVQRVHQSVRRIMTLMQYDFRQAQSVDTVNSVFGDDDGVLIFTVPGGTEIRYDVANKVLERTAGAGSPQALTTNAIDVEKFNLTNVEATEKVFHSLRFTVQISAGFEGTDQFYRQSYTTSVTTR